MILGDLGVEMRFTHLDTGADKRSWGKRFDALDPPVSDDPHTIFLHRDPRDVVVSLFYEMTKRQAAKLSTETRTRYAAQGVAPPVDLEGFVMSPRFGLEKIIVFNLACLAQLKAHVVSYEALRSNTVAEVTKLLAFLGENCSVAAIEGAVEANTFAAMRRREEMGDIPAHMLGRLGATNPSDPNSFKVRRGVVGGWRDEMSPATCQFVEDTLARYDYFAVMTALSHGGEAT